MSTTCSPTGANVYDTEWKGRPARIVQRDHHRHLPATEGDLWEVHPEGNGWRIIEYAPTVARETEAIPEPAPVSEEKRGPASVGPEPMPPKTKAATSPKRTSPLATDGKVWPKMLYAEVVAGGCSDLTDAEHRLLMAMWRYADNYTLGNIWPGHATLAEAVGISPTKSNKDNIGRRIGRLIQKGYVVKIREGRSIPTKVAAEYRLTLPELEVGL